MHVNRKKGSSPARIQNCHRVKTKTSSFACLKKRIESMRAYFANLQTCGSVWLCCICSSLISERRCIELQYAFDIWRSFDPCNVSTLITFTTPHTRDQSLAEVLFLQDKATRIMKNQNQRYPNKKNPYPYKTWKTIMDEMMSVGSFTGRDITFGIFYGWHPHRHEIYLNIKASEKQLEKWKSELAHAWSIAFRKAGGVIDDWCSFMERSVNLKQIIDDNGFDNISSYVTQIEGKDWTLAQEATKGSAKTAKGKNITPFGMLEAIRQGHKLSWLYSQKFYEYAQTMKGKRQFFASKGLKQFLGVNFKSDEELIKESQGGDHYYTFSDKDLNTIINLNIRGEIIALTENRNEFEFIAAFDSYLKEFDTEYVGTSQPQVNWLNEKQELKERYNKKKGELVI